MIKAAVVCTDEKYYASFVRLRAKFNLTQADPLSKSIEGQVLQKIISNL